MNSFCPSKLVFRLFAFDEFTVCEKPPPTLPILCSCSSQPFPGSLLPWPPPGCSSLVLSLLPAASWPPPPLCAHPCAQGHSSIPALLCQPHPSTALPPSRISKPGNQASLSSSKSILQRALGTEAFALWLPPGLDFTPQSRSWEPKKICRWNKTVSFYLH